MTIRRTTYALDDHRHPFYPLAPWFQPAHRRRPYSHPAGSSSDRTDLQPAVRPTRNLAASAPSDRDFEHLNPALPFIGGAGGLQEYIMSSATESTLKGKYDQAAGSVKQAIGEATHNDSLANKGTAQQVKGHAEQAWGSVKSATSNTVTEAKARHEQAEVRRESTHEEQAHDVRESISSTARNVKNHIEDSIASLKK
jgi:uncharacterized protein YjbJ (UPF0337 family)